MKTQSNVRTAFFRLAAVSALTLFIAAPTPGNVGGCGSTLANTPVLAGNLNANPPETSEYMFFDSGLCTYMCQRAFECGRMCEIVNNPAQPCNNNDPELYKQCVRGQLRLDIFGQQYCPHSCGIYQGVYRQAYQWDVQACGEAVLARSCELTGPGSLGDVFRNAPGQCLNSVCPLP